MRRLAGLVDALLIGSALSGAPDPGTAAEALATAVPAPADAGGPAGSDDGSTARPARGRDAHPRLPAYFGPYGGQYVPELLIPALDQLEDAFIEARSDPSFAAELDDLMRRFLGRPTPVTELRTHPIIKVERTSERPDFAFFAIGLSIASTTPI